MWRLPNHRKPKVSHMKILKQKLSELQGKLNGQHGTYETVDEQYNGNVVDGKEYPVADSKDVDEGQDYEAVREQHPNSKDLNVDLATTSDEHVMAEKHSFEGSVERMVPQMVVNKHGMKSQAPLHGSLATWTCSWTFWTDLRQT